MWGGKEVYKVKLMTEGKNNISGAFTDEYDITISTVSCFDLLKQVYTA